MIHYVSGNILDAKTHALVNPINTVGVMGGGLALGFRQKYPELYLAYKQACAANTVQVGQMFVWSIYHNASVRGGYGDSQYPRIIFNFPTKKHFRSPSKLSYIRSGLVDLVNWIYDLNIRSISIPKLGCGLGGLNWEEVRPLIVNACSKLPCEVYIYE